MKKIISFILSGNKDDKKLRNWLKGVFGIRTRNIALYQQALRHSSLSKNEKSNERLEFLGDSILNALAAEYLFSRMPNINEGELTKIRSRMVNRQQLNQLGIKIGVEEVLVKNIVGHTPPTLYGNAFEAVVGAIFLDKRYERTKKIIIENVFGVFLKIDDIINEDTNYKSQLIEYCQKRKIKLEFPCEVKKSESGNTIYYLTVQMDGESVASASHPNKKQAEQLACKSAIHFRES